MAKNLVIVESPAKAKTIEGYLGTDFVVKSSFGHVRDLASKDMGIDIANDFQPNYEVSSDKKDVVKELKKLAKEAEMVWLASDEDREGEAISWHLYETLGLKQDNTRRITFNEITKTAVNNAIENPRDINIDLVNAQQARRILDRLVGFELSPILWRKIKPSLSAGRVQSVAVRLIVERERTMINHQAEAFYKLRAIFHNEAGQLVQADLNKNFKTKSEADEFLKKCQNSNFTVTSVDKKPGKKSPTAPFTTSTLQQEASRKLGYSVQRTMSVAQKLYEAGKITYMRTDSVNLSDDALTAAQNRITDAYGSEYSNRRNYVTKDKGAQEAHEAVRPTDFSVETAGKDDSEERLYDLIWKRAISSQMADAKLERTTVHIKLDNEETHYFVAKGEVIVFEGFLKVYLESNDDEDDEDQEGLLPKMSVNEKMDYQTITSTERFTRSPGRFTEASLVKRLEELGIGRPSTYAPTISTIQKRNYVEKKENLGLERKYAFSILEAGQIKHEEKTERVGADRNKLTPTDIGIVVNDFLVDHFDGILDYNFTATVEKQFDDIADGDLKWNQMIKDFYSPFHVKVETTMESAERASGERLIGVDPTSGKNIYARIGRYGPMVQIGEQDDEEKPKFAGLMKDQRITSITLEEALDLFKLPRDVGMYEDKKVVAAIGRFGPYLRHDSKFISLKAADGDDPHTVEIDRAIVLIEAKRQADREKFIASFEHDPEIQILKGRWGPYIKIGKKNYKIAKDIDPTTLTLEDCLSMQKEQDAGGGKKKKATKRKTAKKK